MEKNTCHCHSMSCENFFQFLFLFTCELIELKFPPTKKASSLSFVTMSACIYVLQPGTLRAELKDGCKETPKQFPSWLILSKGGMDGSQVGI